MHGVWGIWSPVGELRSHLLYDVAKKVFKKKKPAAFIKGPDFLVFK